MSKFNAMFPGVGTPCSDKDIAKEMATLAKANRGTGKDLTKNLSLATMPHWNSSFGVTNGLTLHNSNDESMLKPSRVFHHLQIAIQSSAEMSSSLCQLSWNAPLSLGSYLDSLSG